MSVRILVGDVRERLRDIPDNSIHCCITSPPYFGLRDYGTAQWAGGDPACDHTGVRRNHSGEKQGTSAGTSRDPVSRTCRLCGAVRIDSQIGLENTLSEYIATLVDVFRDVRRVLRNDGTLWLNIGDSYSDGGSGANGRMRNATNGNTTGHADTKKPRYILDARGDGLKPKDLMMVPARLAIALQDDGWYLRSDIIWHKRAPMPESVTDRPTSAHEHVFLLTKQATYFYDSDAIREQGPGSHPRGANASIIQERNDNGRILFETNPAGRNARNVWTLSPEPFPAAHFATFPTEIPRRCIRAGTSEKGCCAACGAPWRRVVERSKSNWPARVANGHPMR
jgi:DNA modification methylase